MLVFLLILKDRQLGKLAEITISDSEDYFTILKIEEKESKLRKVDLIL